MMILSYKRKSVNLYWNYVTGYLTGSIDKGNDEDYFGHHSILVVAELDLEL